MSPDEIRAGLAGRGHVLLGAGEVTETALQDPWTLVQSLVGVRPVLVERQPIRPIAGGRSFASTDVYTPLHTDSQDFVGAPPALQIMACRRPASSGGETLLVDAWGVLAEIEREDPPLLRALFETQRVIPFYFGTVRGPTVREIRGARFVTVSPMPPSDEIGRAFAHFIERAPVIELAVAAGEVLLVDNLRMLHGRRAFSDPKREFLRFLAWMQPSTGVERKLALVLEMTTGVPPAKLAAREGLPEATLYEWRSRAFAAAQAALEAHADSKASRGAS